jgi:tetratricopeptide (TPR) repeat protein
MKRAHAAARRALELAPNDYHNHWLLSRVHYFSGEREQFLVEVEKSLALNSSDGTTIGLIGGYVALAGEWKRGVALVEKAKLLNPRHPDYYHWFLGVAALAAGDDERALSELRRMSAPEWPLALIFLAATSALTEKTEAASRYARDLLELRSGLTLRAARDIVREMIPYQPALVDRAIDALGSTDVLDA